MNTYPPGLTVPLPPVKGYPLPKRAPSFSFIAGTWGDVQAGLGNHQDLLSGMGRSSGEVIYFGPDPAITDWLRGQPMVSGVLECLSRGPVSGIPTDPNKVRSWIGAFNRAFGQSFRAEEVWPCHVDFTLRERLPVHRPYLITSPELQSWARAAVGDYHGHLIMLQPRSETSCLWEGHWPHWYEAVQWLVDAADATLLFCGKGEFDGSLFGDHPQIIDLVNQTPSMPHLFALAEQCERIVTTSNALSLYAAAKGIPAVVCCNTTHRRPEQFFTRFAAAPTSRIVEHWEGMDEFKAAWEGLAK